MRLLAFNTAAQRRLRVQVQLALNLLPLCLFFLGAGVGFVLWIQFARSLGIPANAPVRDAPNGTRWLVVGLIGLVLWLFVGPSVGWVTNALICRYCFRWTWPQLGAVFLRSELPDRWLVKPSGKPPPYRVGLAANVGVGWACILFSSATAVAALRAHHYAPALSIAAFEALGVLLVMSSGHYILDQDAVTHECGVGTFRMRWRDIARIESTNWKLLLIGAGNRFALATANQWSGPDKADATAFLTSKLEGLPVIRARGAFAILRWHWNVGAGR